MFASAALTLPFSLGRIHRSSTSVWEKNEEWAKSFSSYDLNQKIHQNNIVLEHKILSVTLTSFLSHGFGVVFRKPYHGRGGHSFMFIL